MFKKLILAVVLVLAVAGMALASNEGQPLPIYFNEIGSAQGGYSLASATVAIPVSYTVVSVSCTTGAGTVNSLANGRKGQLLTIVSSAQAGSDTIVVTPTTTTGFTTATIGAAKTSVTLLYVDNTYGWIVIGINGATIA